MMVADKRLVTVAQAAKEFRVPVTTINWWIRQGYIAVFARELMPRKRLVDANEIAAKIEPKEV